LITDCFEDVYEKNPNIILRKFADEYVLVLMNAKPDPILKIYTLNHMGAFVWNQIDGKTNYKEIINDITTEFEVSDDIAEKDLMEFLDQMKRIGIIKPIF
jgi:hypothetical protein